MMRHRLASPLALILTAAALALSISCSAQRESKRQVPVTPDDSAGQAGEAPATEADEPKPAPDTVTTESFDKRGKEADNKPNKPKKEERLDENQERIGAESGGAQYFAEDPSGTNHLLSGLAGWHGSERKGKTASGEPFDANKRTGSHASLPFGTVVRVTNQESLESVDLRINDRGPFKKGYIIYVTQTAAQELGLTKRREAQVTLEVLSWGRSSNAVAE